VEYAEEPPPSWLLISGCSGDCAKFVNGIFVARSKPVGERTSYKNIADFSEPVVLWYCLEKNCWIISVFNSEEAAMNQDCVFGLVNHQADNPLDIYKTWIVFSIEKQRFFRNNEILIKKTEPQYVRVYGREGINSHRINGVFIQREEMVGRRPSFQRKTFDGEEIIMWYWHRKGCWMISWKGHVGTQNAYAVCKYKTKNPTNIPPKTKWHIWNSKEQSFDHDDNICLEETSSFAPIQTPDPSPILKHSTPTSNPKPVNLGRKSRCSVAIGETEHFVAGESSTAVGKPQDNQKSGFSSEEDNDVKQSLSVSAKTQQKRSSPQRKPKDPNLELDLKKGEDWQFVEHGEESGKISPMSGANSPEQISLLSPSSPVKMQDAYDLPTPSRKRKQKESRSPALAAVDDMDPAEPPKMSNLRRQSVELSNTLGLTSLLDDETWDTEYLAGNSSASTPTHTNASSSNPITSTYVDDGDWD